MACEDESHENDPRDTEKKGLQLLRHQVTSSSHRSLRSVRKGRDSPSQISISPQHKGRAPLQVALVVSFSPEEARTGRKW